jgi:lipoprotein-anchoring transpeptidase ErfK/SrfK
MRLNSPVSGMLATSDGHGYWLVAEDAGVFTFGRARYYGSGAGRLAASRKVIAITGVPESNGYRMLAVGTSPIPLSGPGDSGPGVLRLQQRLVALGYWLGTPEGQYGPLTQQAVYAFQKLHDLPRTGRVDPATQAAFRNARRPLPRSTSGYMIEVDKAHQVVIVARNGRADWVFNTSTGTEGPYTYGGVTYIAHTPPGFHKIIRQIDGIRNGRLGTLYRPKYFTGDGVALHGSPSIPPYPASHGCVRLTNAAADFIWASNIAPLGTTVYVY